MERDVEAMSEIWQNNLHKLSLFKDKFGHTNVPKSYADQQRIKASLIAPKEYSSLINTCFNINQEIATSTNRVSNHG